MNCQGPCNQGRKLCPCPQACGLSEFTGWTWLMRSGPMHYAFLRQHYNPIKSAWMTLQAMKRKESF